MMNGTSSSRPQAAVIGAGIAGLCAAIALRRAGWEVVIYERSQFKNEVGAAISVTPNATAVLDHWGFDFDTAQPVPNQQTRYKMAADLTTFFSEQYPDVKEDFGAISWSFHRVDLHKGLRDLAVDPNSSAGPVPVIKLGSEVKRVDPDGGILELADGSVVRRDLIVIADGAHTHLVDTLTGTSGSVQPTGRSVYRWLVPMESIQEDPVTRAVFDNELPGFLGVVSFDPPVFLISYTCRGGTLMNVAVVHDTCRGEGEEDAWQSPASKERVHETTANYAPAVHKLIDMADSDSIKVHHLLKRPALSSFVRGRTLIVGDAAHVMMPTHAAAGAAAIESAAALEVLFRDLPDTSDATMAQRMRLFDQLRLPRCNMTMILSNAGPMGIGSPVVEAEIRKYYDGPLPPKGCMPWSRPCREVMFRYNAYQAAEDALRKGLSQKGGLTEQQAIIS